MTGSWYQRKIPTGRDLNGGHNLPFGIPDPHGWNTSIKVVYQRLVPEERLELSRP